MKRRDLIRHIEKMGCLMVREGGKHSRWIDLASLHPADFARPSRSKRPWDN